MEEIVLLDYPLELGRQQTQHFDELFREFMLMGYGASNPYTRHRPPERLMDLMDMLMTQYGGLLTDSAAQRETAAERGEKYLTLKYPAVPGMRFLIASYDKIMDEVDDYCRAGHLLTMPTPVHIRRFRKWTVKEFHRQLDGDLPLSWREIEADLRS